MIGLGHPNKKNRTAPGGQQVPVRMVANSSKVNYLKNRAKWVAGVPVASLRAASATTESTPHVLAVEYQPTGLALQAIQYRLLGSAPRQVNRQLDEDREHNAKDN